METDSRLRHAAFEYLTEQVAREGEVLDWRTLAKGFHLDGVLVPLIGASGIWKPKAALLPISITTAPPVPGKAAPYADGVGPDGLLQYRYQGDDPGNHFNQGLRRAFETRTPLVYFLGVDKGRYRPFWPCFIEQDRPETLSVLVALNDSATNGISVLAGSDTDQPLDRAYARTLTLRRLHQAEFRERVLKAYAHCCAVCRLKHRELLDAAHIVGDRHPLGQPRVQNGLALCKIHHAAFDSHILGITPEYELAIRSDILKEVDGPMLRYGLQAVHGEHLVLPRRTADRPDPAMLEVRYSEFLAAS